MTSYDVTKLLGTQQNLVGSARVTILPGRLFQRFTVLGEKESKKDDNLQLIELILHKLLQRDDA